MSDNDNIPVQKDESRDAFLRYLPRRIAAFEQRMRRYRGEGWDHAGMAVLRGDLLRLGDASSRHGMLETCRHLLILARMVGEHVANMTAPDPQQTFRLFAQLSAVSESMPALGEHQYAPGTSGTTQETDRQHSALDLQTEGSITPPVAKASVRTPATWIEIFDRAAPVEQTKAIEWEPAESSTPVEPTDAAALVEQVEAIEWELAEPSAPVEPTDAAAPIDQAESIEWELAEPSAPVEPTDAAVPIEPAEPSVQQPAEPSAHAEAVETASSIEPSVAIEPAPPIEPELAEPITHVDPVETATTPTLVEASELPVHVDSSGQDRMATPVEPIAAIEHVDTSELDDLDVPDTAGEAGVRRVFHLHDGSAFAIELGQRLESEGYAVEPVESVDELSEMMMCLMPQMVLVDASHMSGLDAIDKIRRDTQERSQTQRHIQLVALAAQDNLETRRIVHREGVDLPLFPPFDIADVVGRLRDLDTASEAQKVRILIVDDERADALFAQTVLNRAGMQAHVENDPMRVLETVKALHPDLVLMDLHMPFVNGVEMTMLIREDPLFARLPIVFLSGESDPDSRLEAINAGGDDFLFKPIRPKNLVAAVKERMRRLHPVSRPAAEGDASNDPNGMQRRA